MKTADIQDVWNGMSYTERYDVLSRAGYSSAVCAIWTPVGWNTIQHCMLDSFKGEFTERVTAILTDGEDQ